MKLQDFLNELAKPRDKRKWIDGYTYKKMMREYRASPEVRERINQDLSLKKKDLKSKNYRRW